MAYALAGAGLLELTVDGQRIAVPVADELRLERELKSKGDRVEVELELIWSTPSASPSGAPQAVPGE
jgi:amphi-Trp domain-containing protein